jgi:hypothetical protein
MHSIYSCLLASACLIFAVACGQELKPAVSDPTIPGVAVADPTPPVDQPVASPTPVKHPNVAKFREDLRMISHKTSGETKLLGGPPAGVTIGLLAPRDFVQWHYTPERVRGDLVALVALDSETTLSLYALLMHLPENGLEVEDELLYSVLNNAFKESGFLKTWIEPVREGELISLGERTGFYEFGTYRGYAGDDSPDFTGAQVLLLERELQAIVRLIIVPPVEDSNPEETVRSFLANIESITLKLDYPPFVQPEPE